MNVKTPSILASLACVSSTGCEVETVAEKNQVNGKCGLFINNKKIMDIIKSESAKQILARSYDGGHICYENAESAVEVAEKEMEQKAIEAFRRFVEEYCTESGRTDISKDSVHYVKVFNELINE